MSLLHAPLAALTLENVERPWLWLLIAMAGAGMLFSTYRGILRRSENTALVWVLMALRAAGLAALALALAKPTWIRETEILDPGRVAVVVDNSLSMSLADPSGQSRYALAREVVGKLRSELQNRRSQAQMEMDLFDINGAPLADELPDEPRMEHTDLVRALSEARGKLRSRPLTAMVLISDGMDNTGRSDFQESADSPVPIHTIGFRADADSSRLDLAVRRVHAPERALVHNEIKVDVLVSKTAGPQTLATVTIKRGHEELARQAVAFAPGDAEQNVAVRFTPTQPGTFVFTANVAADAGERVLANNSMQFPLRIDAEPIRVLYIEGFLRYEYKFLRDRFENDPDIQLVSVIRRANPERTQSRSDEDLITALRLKNLDVVILGDMEANYLNEAEYQALLRWVDQGHALLVLGGYHSFGPDGFRTTSLADVLPVVFAEKEPYQSEEPFVLKLTDEGARHPIFEVAVGDGKDAALWSAAPQLLGSSLVQRVKPGATVLATNPNIVRDGQAAPVIATQRYGAGRTMVLTADTTWRWTRFTRIAGQSDTLYARFWSQTLRWLSGRTRDDKRPLLALNTDRPAYDVGKPVTIRLTKQPRPDMDLTGAETTAEVSTESGKTVSLQLRSDSRNPDLLSAMFYPPAGGRYRVAAALSAAGKPVANQTTEFLVHGSELELADTGTNRANLQAIASATGGVYLDIEDAVKLGDKIERKERRLTQVRRTEFWNSPALFLFFLGAVTVEWVMRRRHHLV
jgi:uncharacterized membrane protein